MSGAQPAGQADLKASSTTVTVTPAATTVAFLGPVASYTHQAAKLAFVGPEWDLLPVATIHDVFEAVRAGTAAYGVVPFENSTHGPVTFTLAGLADRDNVYGALSVAQPTAAAAATAAAAEPAGTADPTGATAAISSALAAETTGLNVLARCIEDRPDNTTRFYVLREAGVPPPPTLSSGRTTTTTTTTTTTSTTTTTTTAPKSLVSFTVPHRSPGALATVLDCFRRAGLNLTSINSLPSLIRPFQYLFFVEFEHSDDERAAAAAERTQGHDGPAVDADETPEQRVQRVLAEVGTVAQTWRLLGTWTKPAPLLP
ncbi:Prephenate dehydratase [Niveomyces insectorum RCEF 264]|uniref:Prephenate dehydratase n=1 Tax=Niveomyces insectorum RCEF 264 TaxID=1081102 RepID=A0A162KK10_9HYPO|nr:Prephenate dehydratase [Niveomyces insectorum RCEF 264]